MKKSEEGGSGKNGNESEMKRYKTRGHTHINLWYFMIFINVGPSCSLSHIVVVVHDVDINWLLMSHFFLLSVVSCMHNIKTQLLEYMTVGNVGYSTISTNNRPMGSNGMPNARWVKAFLMNEFYFPLESWLEERKKAFKWPASVMS